MKADRSRWLEEQLETMAADLEQGRTSSLWALVRVLSGRKRRKSHVAAAVARDEEGVPLGDSDAVNVAWRALISRSSAALVSRSSRTIRSSTRSCQPCLVQGRR